MAKIETAPTKYVLVALTEAERDWLLKSIEPDPHPATQWPGQDALLEKLNAPPALTLPDDVIQRLIITRLVKDLLAAGYAIEVHDHTNGETNLELSKDRAAIMAAIFDPAIDADDYVLHVYHGPKTQLGADGWVRLIDGNGWSVISDYTTNLEPVVKGASELADQLEEFEV